MIENWMEIQFLEFLENETLNFIYFYIKSILFIVMMLSFGWKYTKIWLNSIGLFLQLKSFFHPLIAKAYKFSVLCVSFHI